MKAREGDLVEAFDGNIFDVKGLVHPPDRIIAFIRFTPDPKGERKRGNVRYKKVYPLRERFELLQHKFPRYLVFDSIFGEQLCEVPAKMVNKHYEPAKYLGRLRHKRNLQELERQTLAFAQLLKRKGRVKWETLGVSGSLLAGLQTSTSDIDIIVYGSNDCRRVYGALKSLIRSEDSNVKSYGRRELELLFDFRSKDTAMEFEDFVRTESRKVLQGKFHRRDYFVRCVKEWSEIDEQYGSIRYERVGEVKITATVTDDSNMIFTPCIYQIEDVETLEGEITEPLCEIVSFRGRFCEQARNGERVIARGKVERVRKRGQEEYFRLLLGSKPSDSMILA